MKDERTILIKRRPLRWLLSRCSYLGLRPIRRRNRNALTRAYAARMDLTRLRSRLSLPERHARSSAFSILTGAATGLRA
jgi:hypothetical protein